MCRILVAEVLEHLGLELSLARSYLCDQLLPSLHEQIAHELRRETL
jgi:hypothetical protein